MKFQAIKKVYPNAVSLTVRSNTGEEIVKDADGNVLVIDSSLVDVELAKLQAEYDSKQYQRDRAVAYPSIQDVVVALAEKEEGNDTMWKEITAKRAKVKADNPKPS